MKFTIEGDESDFDKLVEAKLEQKLARMILTGNAAQPINMQQMMDSALRLQGGTQQQQTLPYYQHPQHALPAAQPQPTSQAMHVPQYAPPTIIDTPFQFQLPADTPPPRRIKQVRFGKRAKRAAAFAGTIIVLGGGIVVFDLLNQAGFMSPNLMPSAVKQDEAQEQTPTGEGQPQNEAATNDDLLPVPDGEIPATGDQPPDGSRASIQDQLEQYLNSPAAPSE